MRKKIISLFALVLVLSLISVPAYAASDEAVSAAKALHQFGLFNGTGTDAQGNPIFDLDRVPTRNEAVTMLVRLLGKEDEAKSKEWSTPFTDLDSWVKPYVGYAYHNGLTTGTSGTTFGGGGAVTSAQYITLVLRALGYKDGADFQWDKAWELSDKLGFTNGQYTQWGVQEYAVSGDKNNPIPVTRSFLRGDVAMISYNALLMKFKGTDTTLLESVKGGTSAGEHTHNYITMTAPGSGHYEQVLVRYDYEPVYETRRVYECRKCNAVFDNYHDIGVHTGGIAEHWDFSNPCLGSNTLYYDAEVKVDEKEVPVYEDKWLVDLIGVCTICGQQAP